MKFISGGYYLISSLERPDYMDKEVIPNVIFSASECLCDFHPSINILWGKSKNEKEKYAEKLKISQSTYQDIEDWVGDMFEKEVFVYPQLFTTVDLAKEFYNKFLNHLNDIQIIGIGLPEEYVDEFIKYESTLNKTRKEREGIENLVLHNVEVENKAAKIIGYEVLGFEFGTFHSYLCNGLEKDFKKHFTFVLNENGLIPTLEESARYCVYSNNEDVGTEPVLWLPWAIFKYID